MQHDRYKGHLRNMYISCAMIIIIGVFKTEASRPVSMC